MEAEQSRAGQRNLNLEVQGLRGVAVLLVVVFHAWPQHLTGGYVGVDVFFVISGYLITGLIVREIDARGRLDLWRFYARRIRRLLPASLLVLACTTLAAWAIYAPGENRIFTSTAIASAAYMSNVWFAHEAVDYLSTDWHANPLLHTWSLAVEEQFYLFWPALLLLSSRVRQAIRVRWLVQVIAALTAASLIGSILLTHTYQAFAFFSMPTRIWEFGVGSLVAIGGARLAPVGAKWRHGLAFLGAVGVLGSALVLDEHSLFPGWVAIPSVVGAASFIIASLGPSEPGQFRPLRNRLLTWFGDVSYSLYLWHWPVLVFMRDLIYPYTPWHSVSAVALSIALAWATVRWIEQPVRRSGYLINRPARLSILGGGAVTVLALGFVSAIRGVSGMEQYAEQYHPYALLNQQQSKVRQDGCHLYYFETSVGSCEYGSPNSSITVMLVGDSHAAHWFPAFELLAERYRWRLVSLTKAACPAWHYEPYNERLKRQYSECSAWRERVYARIQQERPSLLVVLTTGRFEPVTGTDLNKREKWVAAVQESGRLFSTWAEEVVVLDDTPWPGYNVPKCLARAARRHDHPGAHCTVAKRDQVSVLAHELERKATQGLANVTTVESTRLLCASDVCPTQVGELVLYSDDNHLSEAFVMQQSGALWSLFPERVRKRLISRLAGEERLAGRS